MFIFNKNAIRNKLQHYKTTAKDIYLKLSHQKDSVKTQNKKADLASAQSFPASDPPGHLSTSPIDKELHR